jgi:hypothetical protein
MIKQFSPRNNEYSLNNANHINHYVNLALEITKILNSRSNIVEIGANHGILSLALQILGHNILCTDIHHDINGKSQPSYKVGTWIRENFLGLSNIRNFHFGKDTVNDLDIFTNGIDIIVTRSSGIVNVDRRSWVSQRLTSIKNRICLDDGYTKTKTILDNISLLFNILKSSGVLFIKNDSMFHNFSDEKRKYLLDNLTHKLSCLCSNIDYKIEKDIYIQPGWKNCNVSLICYKK